eukprot:gene18719-25244_t
MEGLAGSSAGFGNSRNAWEEFKPYKRQNKHTRAREASSSASSMDEAPPPPGGEDPYIPQDGDLVEYPLPEVVMADLQDGRTHGVGLLVGRNMDRGDASKLPPELLDLCEVEPLRQEEAGSSNWICDELDTGAYVRLGSLRKLQMKSFDPRFDIWQIGSELSPGCGGPELPEEIML